MHYRLHYEVPIDSGSSTPFPCQYTPSNPYCDSPNAPSSPSELGSLDGGPGSFYGGQHLGASGPNSGVQLTGLPQQPRQKGRPRKRKPKDIEAMTSSLGMFMSYANLIAIFFYINSISQNMSVIELAFERTMLEQKPHSS